jgi:hypothetical protein
MFGILKWFRRDIDEYTFKDYLDLLRREGNLEEADKLYTEIPVVVGLFEKNKGNEVTLSDIEGWKWKDVKFKLNMIEREQLSQLEAYTKLLENIQTQTSIGVNNTQSDDGWNHIVNTAVA